MRLSGLSVYLDNLFGISCVIVLFLSLCCLTKLVEMNIKNVLLLSLILSFAHTLFATHNRAGEITYEQTGPLTIRATITTYTKTSSVSADRDSLELFWGDGTSTTVGRSVKVPMRNDIQFNQYVISHTYPGNATFILSMTDPNRNGGILNVNPPLSDNIEFYIQTEVRFVNIQFQGFNSSPILLQPPVDIGYVGQIFQHTPNAWDPDGDSIAYELVTPLQAVGSPVPNYILVTNIAPGINNTATFDPITGLFTWNAPQVEGEYNIAILVKSYRDGVFLGAIFRDMQILIKNRVNRPPVIQAPNEICVVAGQVLEFQVRATDPDVGNVVRITGTGGPFRVPTSPATLSPNPPLQGNPAFADFRWVTNCDHIQDQYYQVAFKAEDNDLDTVGATAFHITRIKVVGPPVENLTANSANGAIDLCWDAPYLCANHVNFKGFSIWRKTGCNPGQIDTCNTDPAAQGFTRLNPILFKPTVTGRYCYTDNNVQSGGVYTYIVVPHYANTSPSGFSYNPSLGVRSEGVCVQMGRDLPLMLNVDVTATDLSNGQIFVRWTKPSPIDLDTIDNPGPYTFNLFRGTGFSGSDVQVATFTAPIFGQLNDTTFNDLGLNTVADPYRYRVEFFVRGSTRLGTTFAASSVFLTINPGDRVNRLSWAFNVPWSNFEYDIYRKNPSSTTYLLIATTPTANYIDSFLVNGDEYCYYIEARGTYGLSGVRSPLVNKSQRVCSIPRDNEPPCPPAISVIPCPSNTTTPESGMANIIEWVNRASCARDVASFNIYYAPTLTGNYVLVGNVVATDLLQFRHVPMVGNLSGCYYITAIDSVDIGLSVPSGGNEGIALDTICVDNCPLYPDLPNTFTPNGDGQNDLFRPFQPSIVRFISSVNFRVFNRWGQEVFTTTDPQLNWNGKNNAGVEMPEGVYFYICNVFERRLAGDVELEKALSGEINLVR
jgi:gliding motility-associated-like protein